MEVELKLESSMATMETKLLGALEKMPAAYLVPGTIRELKKLMQPKRATWSAITMGEYTAEQKRPGPSIFFLERRKYYSLGIKLSI
ncbi:hypothetical protein AVEN_144161-1 [Araneus ventricosus]|uniref:Uncharacterized protein n=1 Tax=Araneus ventricosus TaxID=182803 RepID=A0A4Y2GDD7_ARAVE|nr:hypothetical protein AVEN_144161-1 [Araneus ventricosus]